VNLFGEEDGLEEIWKSWGYGFEFGGKLNIDV